MFRSSITLLFACAALLTAQSPAVSQIRVAPLPSAQDIAGLESHLRAYPDDLDARVTLLSFYADTAPAVDDPARRVARLRHILYLVEHHPEAPAAGMSATYTGRAKGSYANADDHAAVRNGWLAAVDTHPGETAVVVNAVRFLGVEDKSEAEDLLRRAMAASPGDREIAANLGFLYAMEILGLDSMTLGARASGPSPELVSHAAAELERSSDAFVLAGAGTALPNLAMSSSSGRVVDPRLFELAEQCAARARKLAPGDADIQGPMPLIRYFAAARGDAQTPAAPLPPPRK